MQGRIGNKVNLNLETTLQLPKIPLVFEDFADYRRIEDKINLLACRFLKKMLLKFLKGKD